MGAEVMKMNTNTILVCDDDKEIVDAIEIYLSQEGYQILKAYDGLQAVSMMEKQEIQLLIIDIMMPKLDGLRATLKIREKSSIPIIILSAKSEDADKILGLNIGALMAEIRGVVEHLDGPCLLEPSFSGLPAQPVKEFVVLLNADGLTDGKDLLFGIFQ